MDNQELLKPVLGLYSSSVSRSRSAIGTVDVPFPLFAVGALP